MKTKFLNVGKIALYTMALTFILASCEKDDIIRSGHTDDPGQVSAPVSEGGITPYIIEGENSGGNRTCAEAAEAFGIIGGFEYSTDKVDYENDEFEGDFDVEKGILTVTTDGTYVTWSFTPPAGWCLENMSVIVKGSADANVYFYDSAVDGDSGLASPINASGNPAGLSNLTFCYNLVECGEEECEWVGETAFGGDTEGEGPAWWFAFDTEGESRQGIYAGQKLVDGAYVEYDSETDVLTIVLGENMKLQDVTEKTTTKVHPRTGAVTTTTETEDEQVKVQGYDYLPDFRPAAGQFTLYKGRDLEIQGNGSRYYVIHLDVEVKVCEN